MTLADYKTSIAAMPDFQAASRVVYGGTLSPTGARVEWTLNILHRFNEQGQLVEDFTARGFIEAVLKPGGD